MRTYLIQYFCDSFFCILGSLLVKRIMMAENINTALMIAQSSVAPIRGNKMAIPRAPVRFPIAWLIANLN